MEVNLPEDILQRLKQRVADGLSEVDVIRKGLDALDRQDDEREAIQAGLHAMNVEGVQDFEVFDRELRERHGLSLDGK